MQWMPESARPDSGQDLDYHYVEYRARSDDTDDADSPYYPVREDSDEENYQLELDDQGSDYHEPDDYYEPASSLHSDDWDDDSESTTDDRETS
jgi:hypothetical protein